MQNSARYPKGTGRIARALAAGLLLTFAVITADPQVSVAQTSPSPLHGEFTIGKNGRLILLPVRIGERDVLCMLDTGASLSAFDMTLRAHLGKHRESRLLDTPGARKRVETFDWPSVKLGDQTLSSSKPVAGIDLEVLRQASNEQIFGVIGMDVVGASRVQIDFDRGILRFLPHLPRSRDQLGERIPIRFSEDGTPRLAGSIAEKRMEQFLIDTGTQGNSLAPEVFDELIEEGHLQLGSTFASVTIAGSTSGERGLLDSVTVGPFTHARLRFSRVRMSSLGLRYFSRFRATFDFPGECLYLQKGVQDDKSEPQATSGLILKWIDGEARVDGLREGGSAESAGVLPGDILVQIEGRPARDYDSFALRELMTSRAGRKIAVTVRRRERRIDFEVVLDSD